MPLFLVTQNGAQGLGTLSAATFPPPLINVFLVLLIFPFLVHHLHSYFILLNLSDGTSLRPRPVLIKNLGDLHATVAHSS